MSAHTKRRLEDADEAYYAFNRLAMMIATLERAELLDDLTCRESLEAASVMLTVIAEESNRQHARLREPCA